MDFPIGFPARLEPRAEVAVLRAFRKHPRAEQIGERIEAGWLAFAGILIDVVKTEEIEIEVVPFLLDEFLHSLFFQDIHGSRLAGFTFSRRMASSIEASIKNSDMWIACMEKLDRIARQKARQASRKEKPKEPSNAKTRSEKRRGVLLPILKDKGMTRSQWADRAGVDPSVVYDYLDGKSNPRPENRKALAEAIGMNMDELPQ